MHLILHLHCESRHLSKIVINNIITLVWQHTQTYTLAAFIDETPNESCLALIGMPFFKQYIKSVVSNVANYVLIIKCVITLQETLMKRLREHYEAQSKATKKILFYYLRQNHVNS